MNGKIIVSMTSYPKRISLVGRSITALLEKQTMKPDEIHLWLSEEEFVNFEKDLPNDLNEVLKNEKVFLHWVGKNTYCHKRYEIFNITNDDDCVFIIDDEIYYPDNTIETCMERHQKFPNAIVMIHQYASHLYDGKRCMYENVCLDNEAHINVYRVASNSLFPSRVFPKYVLSEKYKEIRDRCTPVCDESWMQPFYCKEHIQMTYCHLGWGEDIEPENGKKQGLVSTNHNIEENGLERRDNWLANVLNEFPEIKKIYEDEFGYGKPLPTTKKYNGEKAVIALTSWKKRIDTVHKTIENLFTQGDYHICLTLSTDEFPLMEKELPQSLMQHIDKFEILWIKPNLYCFKKILFAMDKYKEVPIISADDDCIYTENYADKLYNAWLNDKDSIYSYCIDTFIKPFVFQNGPAAIYPPNCFGEYKFKYLSSNILKTLHDDIYYGILSFYLKIKINGISNIAPYKFHTSESPLSGGKTIDGYSAVNICVNNIKDIQNNKINVMLAIAENGKYLNQSIKAMTPMLEYFKEKDDRFDLYFMKHDGSDFEKPGLLAAKQLSMESKMPTLYLHTKGAYNWNLAQDFVIRMWFNEFVINIDKYISAIDSNQPIVASPFIGTGTNWYNGFLGNYEAWNKLVVPEHNGDRYVYEQQLFKNDNKDIKLVSPLCVNLDIPEQVHQQLLEYIKSKNIFRQ